MFLFHSIFVLILICLALLLFTPPLVQTSAILTASKYILTNPRQNVVLNCANADLGTKVTISVSGEVVYDSLTSNKENLGPDLDWVNHTAIIYSRNITSGVVDAFCSHNDTDNSPSLTIPYLSSLTFTASPPTFNLSQTFQAQCTVELFPALMPNLVISFKKDSLIVGQWTFEDDDPKPIWSTPELLPYLNVTKGVTPSSTFTAQMTPITEEAAGKYWCGLTFDTPRGIQAADSFAWNTNSASGQRLLSIWTVFLAVLASIHFVFRPCL